MNVDTREIKDQSVDKKCKSEIDKDVNDRKEICIYVYI